LRQIALGHFIIFHMRARMGINESNRRNLAHRLQQPSFDASKVAFRSLPKRVVSNARVLSSGSELHTPRIAFQLRLRFFLLVSHPSPFLGYQSMNPISRIEQARIDARLRQEMEDRLNVIRKAWDLVEPDSYDRDPQWLRIAASRAAKAGRLPRRIGGELVFMMLARAGYGRAIDHPAIERVDGIRKVIFEPYESSCSMDTARRMAAELAIRLECDARVSLCSWHYPGFTIRITLAPPPTSCLSRPLHHIRMN
jgi:hypothetical protein